MTTRNVQTLEGVSIRLRSGKYERVFTAAETAKALSLADEYKPDRMLDPESVEMLLAGLAALIGSASTSDEGLGASLPGEEKSFVGCFIQWALGYLVAQLRAGRGYTPEHFEIVPEAPA